MPLTGAAVRLGNASRFGIQEGSPRGCSEFGGDLYVQGANRLILMSNLTEGEGEYVSQALTNDSNIQLFNLGALGEHDGRLYLTNGSDLFVFGDPFRGVFGTADASVDFVGDLNGSGDIISPKGLVSDGTNLHCVDDGGVAGSGVYSIDVTNASKTLIGTIAWPSGLTLPRPLGLFYYDGAFYVVERSEANLYQLSAPDATDNNAMTATRVGTATQFGVSETIPTGCGVFNNRPYLVGSGNDAIYRFIDTDDTAEADAVLDITVSPATVESGGVATVTFTFDKEVTDFTAADVTVSAGTKGALSGSGLSYTMPVTAPLSGSGTITVSVGEDVVTPGNNADSVSFVYTAPVAPLWANIPTGEVDNTFEVELHFNVPVTGLEPGDLRLQAAGVTFLTPNAANTTITAISGTNNYRIAFDLGGILHTDCVIRLVQDAVTYDGETYPAAPIDSAEFRLETSMELRFVNVTIANQSFVVGTEVDLLLPEATGGVDDRTYSLSPTLPSGLVFNATTRRITGIPTGRFSSDTFTYTATDSEGTSVDLTFTIVVTAPVISFASTISNQAWVVGTGVDLVLPVATGGVGVLAYSLVGTLPSGITFTSTGIPSLSGIPTGRFSSASFTYRVTDSEGVQQTQSFTIVVTAPAIAFAAVVANQAWLVGASVDLVLPVASGGVGPFTYSLSPVLPSGVTFTPGTRSLDGILTARFSLTTFTYTATDSEGVAETQSFTIVVTASALVFASTIADQVWTVGTSVGLTLPEASGGVGDLTYSLSPDLPVGVTFLAGMREVTGTPTSAFASATFTYTVTDAESVSESVTFTIVVNAAVVPFGAAWSNVPVGTVDNTFEVELHFDVPVTGLEPGDLRLRTAGVTFITPSDSNTTITAIAGTNNYRIVFDLDGTFDRDCVIRFIRNAVLYEGDTYPADPIDSSEFRLFTAVALGFGGQTIGNQAWAVGPDIDLILPVASGGIAPFTYSLVGTLPSGVIFNPVTRSLSGNPTGRFSLASFIYRVTDGNNDTVELTFTIVVTASAIVFASVIGNQAWTVGTAVDLRLAEASGGVGVFTYSLVGMLPSGVTFNDGTRFLSGIPTGEFVLTSFTYTATDSEGVEVTQTFTIVVTASAIVFASTIANQAWVVGTGVDLVLPVATGGVGALVYSLVGTLPSGITFTSTGIPSLSGIPAGRFSSASFTYRVTDTEGVQQTQSFTIVVTAPAIAFAAVVANQSWTVGVAVALTLPDATGGVGDLVYSLLPVLPAGITFSVSMRELLGTPTAEFVLATFTYTVTDAEGVSESVTFTIVVDVDVLSFVSTVVDQSWIVGRAIDLVLPEARGGVAPFAYSLMGMLPTGITFDSTTRELSGNPISGFASASFTYTVRDASGVEKTLTFTIVVVLRTTVPFYSGDVVVDITQALSTPVNPIRFDRIVLPETMRVVSEGQPRRLSQTEIQGSDKTLQQTTYETAKFIMVEGNIYDNHGNSGYSCQDLIRWIRGSVTTREDRRIFIENGYYYMGRLSRSRVDYSVGTNRDTGLLSLEFVISDPFHYEVRPVEVYTTGIDDTFTFIDIENAGILESPLKLDFTIQGDTASIQINFYGIDVTIDSVMILDSPGVADSDSSLYYKDGDQIIIDSDNLTLTWIPVTTGIETQEIFHHLRSARVWTANPIQHLPVLLEPGRNRLAIKGLDVGDFNVRLSLLNRWL